MARRKFVNPDKITSHVERIAYPKPRKSRKAIVSRSVGKPREPKQSNADWQKVLKSVGYNVGIIMQWPWVFKKGNAEYGPFPTDDEAWAHARKMAIRAGEVKVNIQKA
jgi:hypothetical protein